MTRSTLRLASLSLWGALAVASPARAADANAIRAVNRHSKLELAEQPMLLMEFHGSEAGVREQVMVDCSHANSSKQHRRQIEVAADIAAQISAGERRITGVMIESHLEEGRQDLVPGKGALLTQMALAWFALQQLGGDLGSGALGSGAAGPSASRAGSHRG